MFFEAKPIRIPFTLAVYCSTCVHFERDEQQVRPSSSDSLYALVLVPGNEVERKKTTFF